MPSSFDDLPPELIGEIFDYLPKANDRRRLSQVCKTFYQVVRGQTTKFGTFYLTKTDTDKSPVQAFKNSSTFSKLHVEFVDPDIIQDQDFWQERGQCITELEFNDRLFNNSKNPSIPFNWLTFFPHLKKLKVRQYSYPLIEENAPIIQLPVEELCIEYGMYMDEICYTLQCCPLLKSFEFIIRPGCFQHCAVLLPLIESIETVKMTLEQGVELKEIEDLPSKVVIQHLVISSDITAESLASFFNKPRRIETLFMLLYSFDNEFGLVNSLFTKDKVLQLLKAESIQKIMLHNYVPNFRDSLDLLNQVPGLQDIEISFDKINIYLPFFWSNPNTASKIRNIEFRYQFCPEALIGLSSLSSLTIGIHYEGDLYAIRNHPKLKKLVVQDYDYGDELGDAELEPISSLHDLEILKLDAALNVTSDAFKTIIKFPKLKKLVICSQKMKNDVAMLLLENCRNLEELELCFAKHSVDTSFEDISTDDDEDMKDVLNDADFEHLIRALPYLKKISISGGRQMVSRKIKQKMKMEFPYLKFYVC